MNAKNGAGPPGNGGRHTKSGGQPQGKQVDILSPVAPPVKDETPFWRQRHDHLAALLARDDLSWRKVRVYLALADLTHGYQKPRDVVSLVQIAKAAGMYSYKDDPKRRRLDTAHVVAELHALEKIGLCGSAGGCAASHEKAVRWVVWPPPSLSGPTARAGTKTTAKDGSSPTARAGRHQEVLQEERQEGGKESPPAPSSHGTQNGNDGHQGKADPAVAETDPLDAAVAARFKNPLHAAEAPGHVASDLAAKAYTREDLQAWLDSGGTAAFPSHLKKVVPAFVAARRKAAFAEELRRIHTGNLLHAKHVTADRRARVFSINADAGLMILEERVGGRPGESAEALRRKIAAAQADASGECGFKRDAAVIDERRLRDRLSAVERGKPDPAAIPPKYQQIEIRTPKALGEWEFSLPPTATRRPKPVLAAVGGAV